MLKRFLVILAIGVLTVSQSFAQKPEKKASIALDSTVANLGVFPKSDSKRTTVYTFKNVGSDKLVFYGASPNCGCVTVSYPENPVKPGRKGKIIVNYNGAAKKPVRFSHKINFSVSGSPSHFTLRLNGEMTKN